MNKTWLIQKGRLSPLGITLLILLPILSVIVCLGIGRMYVPLNTVLDTLLKLWKGEEINPTDYSIIVNLRLPRIIMALIVGAGLTCAGAAFQSLFSNPLATPDILGVTSGTCVGAILAIILSMNLIQVQLIALLFGLVSVWITLNIARDNKKTPSIVVLILSGVIISSLFNAIGSLMKYTADPMDKLPTITYWLMGSFASSSYRRILIGSPLILLGIVMIFLLRWRLNILSLSEAEAIASGIDIKKTRLWFIIASTFITASSVAMCGQVGWIGLLMPHCARMLAGSNNRYVIPVGLSLGAVFMVITDTLSRTISVIELPVSILTAIIGAPVFISLLRNTKGSFR